ncbi:hypothetical protein F7234_20475 [Pseudomonas putida]|nr:hypothetical protein F7234_20475 [Pseudomonas putida]
MAALAAVWPLRRASGTGQSDPLPVMASSRVNPLPQDYLCLEGSGGPVGAGLPAKRPVHVQATPQTSSIRLSSLFR